MIVKNHVKVELTFVFTNKFQLWVQVIRLTDIDYYSEKFL